MPSSLFEPSKFVLSPLIGSAGELEQGIRVRWNTPSLAKLERKVGTSPSLAKTKGKKHILSE
jgi:hypothetical protein